MPKCHYCSRRLKKWHLKCRVCRRRTWRLPHYLIAAFAVLMSSLAVLLFITYLTQ